MPAISSLTAQTGAAVDTAADLLLILDMSLAGNARDKKITIDEFMIAIGAAAAIAASVNIAAGDFVSIHASAGAKIRKADATDDTKPVHAFAPAAIVSPAAGTAIFPGRKIKGLAGLTPGAIYYLDTSPGLITDTPPSGSGNLLQEVGVAVSATELLFNPKQGITL
jgi:hypothetical protein